MAYTTIDDPSAHFKVQLYTGDGSADHAITFDDTDTDMQPDLVWIKNRDATDAHCLFDAARGVTKLLSPNTDAEEITDIDTLDAFQSDGFRVDADIKVNTNTEKYVAFCWKCNGAGSSNTTGSINTTKTTANTTSGVSVITYTGNATTGATIGHGIGAAPKFIIIKKDASDSDWVTWINGMVVDGYIYMNSAAVATSDADFMDSTLPSSTVVTLGNKGNSNGDGDAFLCLTAAPVQGFSKFGSYEGNGKVDGTFVYTGFRPAFIMTRSIDSTSSMHMYDDQREGYNPDNDPLVANDTDVESTQDMIDILSNGFKFRIAGDPNVAETYVYMAFAKAPFVNSNGVPCNAR